MEPWQDVRAPLASEAIFSGLPVTPLLRVLLYEASTARRHTRLLYSTVLAVYSKSAPFTLRYIITPLRFAHPVDSSRSHDQKR